MAAEEPSRRKTGGLFAAGKRRPLSEVGVREFEERVRRRIALSLSQTRREMVVAREAYLNAARQNLKGKRRFLYLDVVARARTVALKAELEHMKRVLACFVEFPDFVTFHASDLKRVQSLSYNQNQPQLKSLERLFVRLMAKKGFYQDIDRLRDVLLRDETFSRNLYWRRQRKKTLNSKVEQAKWFAEQLVPRFREVGKVIRVDVLNYLSSIKEILEVQKNVVSLDSQILSGIIKSAKAEKLNPSFVARLERLRKEVKNIGRDVLTELNFWRAQSKLFEKKTRK